MPEFQVTVRGTLGTEDHLLPNVSNKQAAKDILVGQTGCKSEDIIRVREVFTERTLEDDRTLQQLAQEALDVQDAVNLMAVARSFSLSILRLRKLLNLGTDDLRAHPIVVLWCDKLADMTHHRDRFTESYSKVTEMATNNCFVKE